MRRSTPVPIADPIRQRIHATVDSIPRGRVATYGEVASEAMLPRRARLVGRALRELPSGSKLAWHRVLGAGGRIRVGGASAREQRLRLVREGVRVDAKGRVDMKQFGWKSGGVDDGAKVRRRPRELKRNGELDDPISRTRSRRGRRSTSARSRESRDGVESKEPGGVLGELERRGLLLQQDQSLPNVVQLVTGETLRSSWWKHPLGREIFRTLGELADHEDVLFTKLVGGKVTLVHRELWPALVAVAMAREEWQTRDLSAAARKLLARVDAVGTASATGAAAKELETRLLVVSTQHHTESGKHELVLESWPAWSKRARCKPLRNVTRAKDAIEAAASALGAEASSLPWARRR